VDGDHEVRVEVAGEVGRLLAVHRERALDRGQEQRHVEAAVVVDDVGVAGPEDGRSVDGKAVATPEAAGVHRGAISREPGAVGVVVRRQDVDADAGNRQLVAVSDSPDFVGEFLRGLDVAVGVCAGLAVDPLGIDGLVDHDRGVLVGHPADPVGLVVVVVGDQHEVPVPGVVGRAAGVRNPAVLLFPRSVEGSVPPRVDVDGRPVGRRDPGACVSQPRDIEIVVSDCHVRTSVERY